MSVKVAQKDNQSLTMEKIEQSFLTCPICYEVFNHPKCLPCLHTFCRHCLGSYIESQEDMGAKRKMGFPCPVCKQFVFVKKWTKAIGEWVDDIQNNFLIQNMIDCLVTRSEPMSSVMSASAKETEYPSYPSPSAPPLEPEPEPERNALGHRSHPSAPPLSPWSNTTTSSTLGYFQHEHTPFDNSQALASLQIEESVYSGGYQWNSLNRPPWELGIPQILRPSSSTIDLSPGPNTSLTANNLFMNRSNSSNDLSRQETTVLFQDTTVPWDVYYRRFSSKAQYSDVCCLPKRSSVVVTDYSNCKVILFKYLLQKGNYHKSVKVKGRPCSIALLNEEKEDCVVVNLQSKSILIFISIPDMEILRKVKTVKNYRCVAALSPTTLLVGSPDRPASIDIIEINRHYDISSVDSLFTNGPTWDLSSPTHMCILSPTSFMVSDSEKKSLICYDIIEEDRRKKAKKRFTIAPRRDRKFRVPGSLFYDRASGNVYTVDYGHHSVLRVVLGDTQLCETLMKESDGIYKPSAVCLGRDNQLCVVDWEGNICVYVQRATSS